MLDRDRDFYASLSPISPATSYFSTPFSSPLPSPRPFPVEPAEWSVTLDPDALDLDESISFQSSESSFNDSGLFSPPQSQARFFYAQKPQRRRLHPLTLIPAFLGGAIIAYFVTRAGTGAALGLSAQYGADPVQADLLAVFGGHDNIQREPPTHTINKADVAAWRQAQHRRPKAREGALEEYRRRCLRITSPESALDPDQWPGTIFQDGDEILADLEPSWAQAMAGIAQDAVVDEHSYCAQLARELEDIEASSPRGRQRERREEADKTRRQDAPKGARTVALEDSDAVNDVLAWYGYGEKAEGSAAAAKPIVRQDGSVPPTHVLGSAPSEPGDYITSLFEQGGIGTRVFLRPGTIWNLETPILLTHDDQELATLDYPEDDDEKAILQTVGKSSNAINCGGLKRTRVKSLVVDGQELRFGRTQPPSALVFMAGPDSEDQVLEDCVLRHPRGWSCCHVYEYGLRPRVLNNRIGPAGRPPPRALLDNWKGPWADGLSVASFDSLIAGNTIVDATDGGIVLFGAPGSLVTNNTVIARTRDLLGGINLVDKEPYDGNYTGTRVLRNRIISDGAYIRLGIGVGSRPWKQEQGIGAFGGVVKHNVFGPGQFGYAMAVGGAKDMVVSGNKIHRRTVFEGQAPSWNPAAQPFVKYTTPEEPGGDLQPGFVEGFFRMLIGISPGPASSKKLYADGFRLRPGPGIKLRSARLELSRQGMLVLRDERTPGTTLWTSGASSENAIAPRAMLTVDGILEVRDVDDALIWASADGPLPLPYPGQTEVGASITISETAPHITVSSKTGDIVFTSPVRHFPVGWQLSSGQFISLSDSKPAWLILDPRTSALVLHTSPEPLEVHKKSIVWRSPHRAIKWDGIPEHKSIAILQDDSNLVINTYEEGAIWATDTDEDEEDLPYLAIYGPDEPGGMRLDLLGRDLRPRWSSFHDHRRH